MQPIADLAGSTSVFSADVLGWVRAWSAHVEIRCGGYDPPPDPPFLASLYPFTTLTKLDFEGYPNFRDKRLEANLSLGAQGWYIGYEDGEYVAAGVFRPGRKLRFDLELAVRNATHGDTFVEFVVEPNAHIGVYDGADRMRCLAELGAPWSGLRQARAWFEVEALAARDFRTRGELRFLDAALPLRFDVSRLNADYDALALDALWQLRWRIDRAAHLEAYDGAFQVNDGVNGHAIEREIVVSRASLRGI